LGKSYGIKSRCYWEHLEEHTWEQFGNLMGTREKIPSSPHTPFSKEKSWTLHEFMLSLPIGCMEFLFPNLFVIIFCQILGTMG